MKIRPGHVVFIHYTLTDDIGTVIDSSLGYEPLEYVQGEGQIVPGLENFLVGGEVGFSAKVAVPPEDAYGVYNPNLVIMAQADNFAEDMALEIGMQVQTELPDGMALFQVIEISSAGIKLDANHPLAGKTLHFDVEVVDVQEAVLADSQSS